MTSNTDPTKYGLLADFEWMGDYDHETYNEGRQDAIDWKQMGYHTVLVRANEETWVLYIRKAQGEHCHSFVRGSVNKGAENV